MSTGRGSRSSAVQIEFDRLFYRDLQRQFVVDLLKKDGDFLLRRGSEGGIVLSVNKRAEIYHFKFAKNQTEFKFDGLSFRTLIELLQYYYDKGKAISRDNRVRLLNPVQIEFDLIERSRLRLEKQLGAGNFGQVWKGKLKVSGKPDDDEAVKILSGESSELDRKECLAEARIMSSMDHENVTKIKGVCFAPPGDDSPQPQLMLILELCTGGSLDKMLQKNQLTEKDKVKSLFDSSKGLAYLHERDIIHRDIASRNVLVMKTDNRLSFKIADFGLSRMAPDQYELATKRRLPVYSMPPESLELREWSKSSDIWSFGVLMLEVYNKGKNPYEEFFQKKGADVGKMAKELNSGTRVDPPKSMPAKLVEIMGKCMERAEGRPTMETVAEWLKKVAK